MPSRKSSTTRYSAKIDIKILTLSLNASNVTCGWNETSNNLFSSLFEQIPRKQVVEKPAREIERQSIEMDRKKRTYTLLEDSASDEETVMEKQKRKKKSQDRGNKRKHIRKKKESESSEEEAPKG